MEDVLLRQMTGILRPDPAVIAAAGALSRGVPVGEVARDLGLLPRTLRRRFAGQVGLTPKRFARVQRMQRLVRDLDGQSEVDWAVAAARHGYADQPHLADEFRELAASPRPSIFGPWSTGLTICASRPGSARKCLVLYRFCGSR